MSEDVYDSIKERQLNSIKLSVKGFVDYVIASFEMLGIENMHKITDPSLDELIEIVDELSAEAKQHDDINLQQILLFAQILLTDIKKKNPSMCENSKWILKKSEIFNKTPSVEIEKEGEYEKI